MPEWMHKEIRIHSLRLENVISGIVCSVSDVAVIVRKKSDAPQSEEKYYVVAITDLYLVEVINA